MNIDPEHEQARDEMARLAARAMVRDATLAPREALERVRKGRARLIDGPPPGTGLICRHLRAMLEESLGAEGYKAGCLRRVQAIVEVLDLVAWLTGADEVEVAGRAAGRFLEGPLVVSVRVHGGGALHPIASELERNEIREVGCATAHTRFGPMPSLHFECDGIRFTLIECPPVAGIERRRNLFTGEPVAVASLPDLRARLDDVFSPDRP